MVQFHRYVRVIPFNLLTFFLSLKLVVERTLHGHVEVRNNYFKKFLFISKIKGRTLILNAVQVNGIRVPPLEYREDRLQSP